MFSLPFEPANTSARETPNTTFPPTLKESLVPEMERIG